MLTDETAAGEEDETLLGKGGLPDNMTLPGRIISSPVKP